MEKSEIQAIVRETVKELHDSGHICRIPISDETCKSIPHVLGMVSDVGKGRFDNGVETMRKNHEWTCDRRAKEDEYRANHGLVSRFRRWCETAGGKAFSFVVMALVLAAVIVAIYVLGLKDFAINIAGPK